MSKVSLSKDIFWDVNYKDLDYKKDADFVIQRVLNYGDEEDWQEIKKVYGVPKIKKSAKKANFVNKKTLNFWSLILDIPIDSFKCTKKFSSLIQSVFSRR